MASARTDSTSGGRGGVDADIGGEVENEEAVEVAASRATAPLSKANEKGV